jgi:hypothetical protein
MSEPKNRLPDPDAPPTNEELEAAERLRLHLEGGSGAEHADLVEAIRAAHAPDDLDEARHDALVARALLQMPSAKSNVVDLASARGGRRGKMLYGAFGAVSALALAAAALMLVVRDATDQAPMAASPVAKAPPARSRSTSELFGQQFPVTGGTTDRVDRIAYARQQDLRENRFAAWGVR